MSSRSTNASGFELDARRGSVASESLDPGTTVDDIFTTTGVGTSSAVLGLRDGWTANFGTSGGEELPLGTILMWHKSLEARGGTARETGTATTDTTDKLIDSSATFVTNSVAAGDIVWNSTDSTYATVQSVDSETQLTLDWDAFPDGNEAYSVYPEPDIQPGWVENDGTTISDADSPFNGMDVGEFFPAPHSTGWVACSDWTNQHLGDSVGGNVNHGFGLNLRELDVEVLLSTDGTDANSFLVGTDAEFWQSSGGSSRRHGITVYQVDSNNIKLQTGEHGLFRLLDSNGAIDTIDTESWYYRVEVSPKNSCVRTLDNGERLVPVIKIKNSGDVKLATFYSVSGTDFKDLSEIDNLASGDVLVVWDNSASAYKTLPATKMNYFPPGMLITHEISASETSACATDTWCTTPLNTVRHNTISGASADVVTDHDFVLPAGTYFVRFRQQFMRTGGSYARLYDVTAGAALIYGSSAWSENAGGDVTYTLGEGYITLTQESTLRLEHIYPSNSSWEIGYHPTFVSTPGESVPSMVHILQINELEQTVTQNYDQGAPPLLQIREEQPAATPAGSLTGYGAISTWHTRNVNIVKHNEISGSTVDLTANTFTLPAGVYDIEYWTSAMRGRAMMCRLYDVTNGIVRGTSHPIYSHASYGGNMKSEGKAKFQITQSATFRLEFIFEYAQTSVWGSGHVGSTVGDVNIYTDISVRQIATADPPTITYSYNANTPPTMIVEHQEPSGTGGGAATTGSWQKRTMNVVELNEITGASVSSSEITLPAGTYEFTGWQSFLAVGNVSVRLYDTTAGGIVGSGSSGYLPTNTSGIRPCQGRFTITVESVLQAQYQAELVGVSNALGDSSYADPEVHAHLTIKKVA